MSFEIDGVRSFQPAFPFRNKMEQHSTHFAVDPQEQSEREDSSLCNECGGGAGEAAVAKPEEVPSHTPFETLLTESTKLLDESQARIHALEKENDELKKQQAALAHRIGNDLNNPLQTILGALDKALNRPHEYKVTDDIMWIQADVEKLSQAVKSLIALAGGGEALPVAPTEAVVKRPTVKAGPLKILVVDDEISIQMLFSSFLTVQGHTVETASDGQKGFEQFKVGDFDLVVTDKTMPSMDGLEFATKIKECLLAQGKKQIPVIMVTGDPGAVLRRKGDPLPEGIHAVLGKPIGGKILVETVESFRVKI